jgi:hypothetical protein
VIVAGYPLQGLLTSKASVTTGIVSALAGPKEDKKLIQITAPVQPGNSGGPLVDSQGNVVGIIVSKLNGLRVARTIGSLPENINFAEEAFRPRVGPAVIGDHLAAVCTEAGEIRVVVAGNGVELLLRLPEARFEASGGQRVPVEARVARSLGASDRT